MSCLHAGRDTIHKVGKRNRLNKNSEDPLNTLLVFQVSTRAATDDLENRLDKFQELTIIRSQPRTQIWPVI